MGVCVGHKESCLVGLCGLQEDTSRDEVQAVDGPAALDVNAPPAPMGGGCWFGGIVLSNILDPLGVIAKAGNKSVMVAAGSEIPSYAGPPG